MHRICRTERFDFLTDAAERKARALAHVVALVAAIFEGPGVAPLCAALQGGEVDVFRVALYLAGDVPVGFAMVVHDVVELDGRQVVIARAFSGMREEWRGQQRSISFFLACTLHLLRRHRGEEVWGFVPALHVSSYRVIARHMPDMVPHPDRPASAAQLRWLHALADRFGCQRVEGDHPCVCRRPLQVRGARHSPRPERGPEDAFDRLYRAILPVDDGGACVMTLIPVSATRLLGAVGRYVVHRVRRALRRPLPDASPRALGVGAAAAAASGPGPGSASH
jgi:hypothetical protein